MEGMGNDPHIEAEFRRLIAAEFGQALPRWVGESPPMLLVRPASSVSDGILGARLRYLVTVEDESGAITAFGWRNDLRAASDRPNWVEGAVEPVIWVADEASQYGASTAPAVAVGVSRLWVEQYVGVTLGVPTENLLAVLDAQRRSPMDPQLRLLSPVLGVAEPMGRRAVVLGDNGWEPDWRVAGPARLRPDGDFVVPVIDEAEWYQWTGTSMLNKDGVEPLRMVPTRDVRLE